MDRRQNKTQAQTKAVFVTLLAEMPIEKITVSRIALILKKWTIFIQSVK